MTVTDAVGPAVRVARRQPAQRDAQADREDQRANRELEGRRELQGRNVGRDRSIVDDARTEVALEQLAHVVQVLPDQRLVQAQGLADLGDPLRRRVLAQDRLGRIPGQQPDEQEQDHRQSEQDRDRPDQAADDEFQHRGIRPSVS